MDRNTLSRILNSNIAVAIVSFFLTGIVGFVISDHYQEKTRERQRAHEILQRELNEAQKVLDDVTLHIRNRWYLLQKLTWDLESDDTESYKANLEKYNKVKDEWNVRLYIYKYKIKRLVDEELAHSLYHAPDDTRKIRNRTLKGLNIHSAFTQAHKKFKDYEECRNSENPEACGELLDSLQKEGLDELGRDTDRFIEAAYKIFLKEQNVSE